MVNKFSPEEAKQVAWTNHITEELVRHRTLETGREAHVDGIRSDQPQRKGEGNAVYKHEYSESVRAVMENQEPVQTRAPVRDHRKSVRSSRTAQGGRASRCT